MSQSKSLLFNRLEMIGFLLYFVILFCERLLALIFSVKTGGDYALLSGNGFNYAAYAVTAASLVAGTALAVKPCVNMIRCLKRGEAFSFETESTFLSVAVFTMLFGGMMHTGFTLAGVQFAAYGFLIAAFIVRTVETCCAGGDKFLSVFSVVYLTLFSMTVPVCYISFMALPLRAVFFAAEFSAVAVLVPAFGCMLGYFMKKGETLFSPVFPLLTLLLSGLTVGLQWKEKINYFVLIFLALTIALYLALGIVAWRRQKSQRA